MAELAVARTEAVRRRIEQEARHEFLPIIGPVKGRLQPDLIAISASDRNPKP